MKPKRYDLHYNKKFVADISAYSWIQIFRDDNNRISMSFNRKEHWDRGPDYDFTGAFAVHITDGRFNTINLALEDFEYENFGFTKENIDFFKIALMSQYHNASIRKNQRDVCSVFTLMESL